jgi:S-adenosylmethionine:tRNA-ribosyltransferase-isomerase (queuine synthetase)
MQAVLLHVPKKDISEKLKKIAKKLKENGYFYIAVKEKRKGGPEEEIKAENDYGYKYERFFSFFSKREVVDYMKKVGLMPVYETITKLGNTNWIQIIGKK